MKRIKGKPIYTKDKVIHLLDDVDQYTIWTFKRDNYKFSVKRDNVEDNYIVQVKKDGKVIVYDIYDSEKVAKEMIWVEMGEHDKEAQSGK